jgi:hypothetical protein
MYVVCSITTLESGLICYAGKALPEFRHLLPQIKIITPQSWLRKLHNKTIIPALVEWLWWGKTDVSELRPLWDFCSLPGDLRCGSRMMILTGANSKFVYQCALGATSTVRRSCQQRHLCCSPQYWLVSRQLRHLWQQPVLFGFLPSETSLETVGSGRRKWEFCLPSPWNFKSSFTCRKILRQGTFRLYFLSERKVCCGYLSPLKIHRLGWAQTRNVWVQW